MEKMKELLGGLLLYPDGEQLKTMDFAELALVLDRCKYLSFPNTQNKVTSLKYLRKFGVIDSITKLKGSSTWAFIQESKFFDQGMDLEKVFVFKMSKVGPKSEVTRRKPRWSLLNHKGLV